jgi:hypothetical protein
MKQKASEIFRKDSQEIMRKLWQAKNLHRYKVSRDRFEKGSVRSTE